ncbi:MAG: hypothetical protein ABIL01_11750 [Pseudomonadota bacterium]
MKQSEYLGRRIAHNGPVEERFRDRTQAVRALRKSQKRHGHEKAQWQDQCDMLQKLDQWHFPALCLLPFGKGIERKMIFPVNE